MTKDKKKKLRKVLAALSPELKGDLAVQELKEEIREVASAIPKDYSLSISALKYALETLQADFVFRTGNMPSGADLDRVKQEYLVKLGQIEARFGNVFADVLKNISDLEQKINETKDDSEEDLDDLKESIAMLRREFQRRGGGGAHLQMLQSSSVLSSKYVDVNFIAGSNITLSKADDDTNRRVNFTIEATAGGGFTLLPATGAIDSNNTAFTFTQKPTYIISDGAWYTENIGWTWSGSTATMVIPPNDAIWGFV